MMVSSVKIKEIIKSNEFKLDKKFIKTPQGRRFLNLANNSKGKSINFKLSFIQRIS